MQGGETELEQSPFGGPGQILFQSAQPALVYKLVRVKFDLTCTLSQTRPCSFTNHVGQGMDLIQT